MKTIKEIYQHHSEMPYIAPKYEQELRQKTIAKRQMQRTKEDYLPGHIILLWRIQFGTYTTKSQHHKYFYTTYGIDAQAALERLVADGLVNIDTAFESLKLLSVLTLKERLKEEGFKGLSNMKRAELVAAIQDTYTEETLAKTFDERSYSLTQAGRKVLDSHPDIIAKHPQKKY